GDLPIDHRDTVRPEEQIVESIVTMEDGHRWFRRVIQQVHHVRAQGVAHRPHPRRKMVTERLQEVRQRLLVRWFGRLMYRSVCDGKPGEPIDVRSRPPGAMESRERSNRLLGF